MRAKLREDLLDLVPCSQPFGHGDSRLENFAREYGGRTLEVLNVTVRDVTLRLTRPYYDFHGPATFGITTVNVPHEWLAVDVTKDEFYAWKKAREGGK